MSVQTLVLGRGAPRVRSRVIRRPRGWIVALGVLLLVAVSGILANVLAPYDPNAVDLGTAYASPSIHHLLGADNVGRDLLSRLLFGSRSTLLVPLFVSLIAGVAGCGLALVAAWNGGWIDAMVARFFDLVFSFPGILLAILTAALFGPGLTTVTVALSIAYAPSIGRVVRAEAIRQRGMPYIAAIRLQGGSGIAIAFKHLLPNVAPLVFAQLAMCYGYSLIDAATLSFLGFGVQPPAADWGSMIANGAPGLTGGYPQECLYAGLGVVVVVVAITAVGNWLAERAEVS
jgi:peptide/nickel transport system permease protein